MRDLAKRIVGHLGSHSPTDIDAVEDWLHEDNDDGSPVSVLAERFDSEVGLPTRR